MSKQAPYKLWTVKALQNELKQRNIDITELSDSKDKLSLVELLKADDEREITTPDDEIVDLEDDELDDEPDDEVAEPESSENDDELDDELDEPIPAPAPKVKAKAKAKVEKAVKPKSPKAAPPTKESSNINAKLKEAGLWRPGCQFLSNVVKMELLEAKTEKQKQAIYEALDKKMVTVRENMSKPHPKKTEAVSVATDDEIED